MTDHGGTTRFLVGRGRSSSSSFLASNDRFVCSITTNLHVHLPETKVPNIKPDPKKIEKM